MIYLLSEMGQLPLLSEMKQNSERTSRAESYSGNPFLRLFLSLLRFQSFYSLIIKFNLFKSEPVPSLAVGRKSNFDQPLLLSIPFLRPGCVDLCLSLRLFRGFGLGCSKCEIIWITRLTKRYFIILLFCSKNGGDS